MIDNNVLINSPIRQIKAKVELYNGSTLVDTFTYRDLIKSIDIDRVGAENKFFGFGVCQKLTLHLIDIKRALNITTANSFKVYFAAADGKYISNFPTFKVSETHRDENTNELSITAYDVIYGASNNTVSQIRLVAYTVKEFAEAIAAFIGATGIVIEGLAEGETCFNTYYAEGANFDGSESLRDALDAIAEATQTIYYLDIQNRLVFKRLDKDGAPALEITKNDYFTLDSKTNRRLTKVVSATELGDNIGGKLRESAQGEAIQLTNVDDFIGYQVESKNLIPEFYSLTNTTYENGVYTQIEADTSAGIVLKVNMFNTEGSYIGQQVIWASNTGKHSLTFSFDEPLSTIFFGINGSQIDSGATYNISHLPVGEYTISADFTNITQGSFSWCDVQLEKGTAATPYTPVVEDIEAVNIRAQGKNLLNMDAGLNINYGDGDILTKENDIYTFTNRNGIRYFDIPCNIPAGVDLNFSIDEIENATTGELSFATLYLRLDGEDSIDDFTLMTNQQSAHIKTSYKVNKLVFYLMSSTSSGDYIRFKNPQLEIGTAATAFEPYKEPIEYLQGAEIAAINPTTVLTTNTTGALINVVYHLRNNLSGTTQYVKNNAFWDLREDRAELVDNALAAVYGFTINQFECSWRGNYLLEIGDKISLTTKDNSNNISYVINDTISYNGAFSQQTQWNYTEGEETESTPSNLTEAIKQTFAKVDKVNKEITMVVDETTTIKATAESVSASVKKIDENVSDLTNAVNSKMSAEAVEISIQNELQKGVDKVITSTGFTFDETGLTIDKSNSEITTQITEDGMTIYKGSNDVLTADNEGVKAADLHATTFLIIGNTSRFEDYGNSRTGCFWIMK